VPVIVAFARGETPSGIETAGIVAAVTGVVLVSRARTRADQEPGDRGAALGMALIAALGFGAFFVLVDRGTATTAGSPLWVVVGTRLGALSTMGVIAAFRPEARTWPSGRIIAVCVIGVLDATASALFAYASTRGNLGVTAVLASQYPAVTVILARIRVSERMSSGQAVGVALALTGVALLATG
jgi:drug/metabolite transporter (DMT)-like permease